MSADDDTVPTCQRDRSMSTIQSIPANDIHKICSGQVIISLAAAVKELIENSLDAGSTSVELRLKEHGSKLVEVIDNGSGVEEMHFQAITLKHHTSKLQCFEDLANVGTFGFRGEALSSLCALSKLTVMTRHQNAKVGNKLEFGHEGIIIKRSACSRQIGTTVALKNLFSTLPVRHKEFLRNLRKEYAKMLHILYAYCLISKKIRIICTNTVSKQRTNVVTTNGNDLKDNIAMVFGPKQLMALLEVQQHDISTDVMEEYRLKENLCKTTLFKCEGFISSCQKGCGRTAPDRQFYFVNGRPCDLGKVSRVVNEVYHTYNQNQYPFVLLNIVVDKGSVDVNVTPDKRLIMVEHENILIALIKSSLMAMFEPLNSVLSSLQSCLKVACTSGGDELNDDISIRETPTKVETDNFTSTPSSYLNLRSSFSNWRSENKKKAFSNESPRPKKQQKLNFSKEFSSSFGSSSVVKMATDSVMIEDSTPSLPLMSDLSEDVNCDQKYEYDDISCIVKMEDEEDRPPILALNDDSAIECIMDSQSDIPQSAVVIPFSMESLRRSKSKREEKKVRCVKFRAKIQPEDNRTAEDELRKEITKDDFLKMEVIGQFNLGFIITKMGSDLFIIDQHTSDEKYNFECLNKSVVLETQRLISPIEMELSAMNESILMENMDTFRRNGFIFETETKGEEKHIKLVVVPVSRSCVFGKEDIDEMLYLLGDENPVTMCRPSRIHTMLASRACRKSIMIGKALTHPDMKKLITHMSEMDQPWNCPHGRPTIRHLFNLDVI